MLRIFELNGYLFPERSLNRLDKSLEDGLRDIGEFNHADKDQVE